jgi:hypothetical protein
MRKAHFHTFDAGSLQAVRLSWATLLSNFVVLLRGAVGVAGNEETKLQV